MNLPEFKSHKERDEYFTQNAEHFTLIRADGPPGQRARDERRSLEDIEKLAHTKKTIGGGRYLIYAVIGEQSAYVKSIT